MALVILQMISVVQNYSILVYYVWCFFEGFLEKLDRTLEIHCRLQIRMTSQENFKAANFHMTLGESKEHAFNQ